MEHHQIQIYRITDLIQKTYAELEKFQYSPKYLRKFKYSFKLFEQYALKNDVKYYSEELALAFLEEYCEIFSNSDIKRVVYQERKRAISRLDEYSKYGYVGSKKQFARKKYIFYGYLERSIQKFIDLKTESLSYARIQSIKLYLERFSFYISKIDDVKSEKDLSIKHIIKYIEITARNHTNNTLYASVNCIKAYILFLENNNFNPERISYKIPKIQKIRENSYPNGFTKEQANELLQSITNNTVRERRDYAMLMLAARLGLRASDIANLKFSSIDWEKNEINLVQQKTNISVKLPLLKDVGEAIINYVQNGRPSVQDAYVFIREKKPYEKLSGSSLHMIVDGYLKRAKIKIPAGQKHGPHALRHSLATLLLENNIPISTIKEILAHKSSETTKIYLKVAEKQLLQCALEVSSSPIYGANNVH
ncbi:tyrosine-type recombinase/integrase [Aliarcobacter butzleri]|jgi:integrase/recombinase XerD|uniref:site-specific integrase n=1 Tax=Aliarcobacter butzleri TaxID=28197 RepID=UPI001EDB9598|nr:site-specific integrase [Aliarcobacter butzleri]MCG3687002.1 tyrosine-type recombinase/integrase [Aliarcobacter butzleri]